MKKFFAVPLACVFLSAGCASTAQLRHVEDKEAANQKVLRDTDQRLNALEQSVTTLDSQVAQLKNRTFEVRTRGGQKTSMTVVPILPPAPMKVAASTAAGTTSDSQVGAGASPASVSAAPRQSDVALGQNGPSPVTAAPATASAGAASAGSSVAAPLAAEPASSPASAGEKKPAAKGKEISPVAVAPETAGGPKGRAIDPAAPPRSFPQAVPAASVAAPEAAVATPATASLSQGKAATAGPHGQVGTSTTKASQPTTGVGTPSVGLPPVAAPEPVVPPAVNPINFASQGANQPTAPASAEKGAPAGGNAAVAVPSLPPSDLALPPEYPGLPPVEAPGAATPTHAPVPAVRTPAPTAPNAPTASTAQTAPAKPLPSAAAPSQITKPAKNEKAAYDTALKLMTSGRSAEGITRFEGFLQEYPQGVYAANAEYWIGEGLYAQGKYQEALNQFRKVDASYPQHHKNADALLKTGMCLSRLGDKAAAAEAYKQLLARFPNSESARIARSRGLAR